MPYALLRAAKCHYNQIESVDRDQSSTFEATEALERALKGRLHILDVMGQTLDTPRTEMSRYAPRIITVQINSEKIGEVIGPKGKTIRMIQEETGAQINIEDSGVVTISSVETIVGTLLFGLLATTALGS